MNFFNDFLNKGKSVWTAMGTGTRVTFITFLGAAILLVSVLGVWSSQPDFVLLYGGLTTEDAAAISTHLSDDKIPFRYEASRGAILVPASKADSARLSLAGQGLPKNTTEGFEIFDKSSFGMTEFVQRINYQRALQGTLARNIQAIDAVESAHVSLSIPEDELFSREKKEAKASVVIRLRSNRTLSNEQVGAIKYLVSSSVPKLEAKNVTLVDSTGKMLTRPQEEDSISAVSEEQLAIQKQVEKHFTDKVQSLLDQVLGPNQSVVRVSAQLNLDRVERNSEKMDPDSGVILEESAHSDDSTGKSGGPALAPGVSANTTPNATVTDSAQGSNSRKQKTTSNRYHYNTVSERVIAPVGSVRRLSVAVLVAPHTKPGGKDAKDAGAPAPLRSLQEMNQLNEIVRSAVGYSAERQDVIKVEELPFTAEPVDSALPVVAPTAVWMDMLMHNIGDILAFVGVAIMALVFYKLFSRTVVQTPLQRAGAALSSTSTSNTNSLQERPVNAVMQDEVKQLVSQNSAQAINLIRSMMK